MQKLGLIPLMLIATIGLARAQDAAHGKHLYWSCAYCHGMNGTDGPVGPPLVGVIGRTAGTVKGFPYSDAMKSIGIIWDQDTLAAFIANPQTMVQGTRMIFAGIPNQKDAADLAAYVATLK